VFSNSATFSHSEPEVIIKRKYPNTDLRRLEKRNFRKSKEFFPCGSLILKDFKIQELQVIKMKYPPTFFFTVASKECFLFFFSPLLIIFLFTVAAQAATPTSLADACSVAPPNSSLCLAATDLPQIRPRSLSLATEHCCSSSRSKMMMMMMMMMVFFFSSCVFVVDVAVRGTYSFLDAAAAAAAPCRDSWLQEMKNKKKKIGAYYRPSGCRSRHAVSRFSIFAHGPAASSSSSSKAGSGWGEREERRSRRAPRGPPATLVSTTTTSVS
jgi:hypothetical protein